MRWVYLLGIGSIVAVVAAGAWFDVNYRLLANISLVNIALLASAFAVLYAARSKWWTNRIGRVFLVTAVLLAGVLIQACVAVWVSSEYSHRHVVRFVIYAAGAVAYLPMLVSLWREQQRDRDRNEVTAPPGPP